MRMTKESKNKTTKVSTTLPETNSKTNTSSQTPIEIALKIDENGMTTASNLYTFLELEPKNFPPVRLDFSANSPCLFLTRVLLRPLTG